MPRYDYVFATMTMEGWTVRVEVQVKLGDTTTTEDIRAACAEFHSYRHLATELEGWVSMQFPNRENWVEVSNEKGEGFIAATMWEAN